MQCFIVELFAHGSPRSCTEVKTSRPVHGELLFERNPPNHVATTAWLKRSGEVGGGYRGVRTDVLMPLIHAQLSGINTGSMVIQGIQMRADGGALRAELQAWWIRLSV